MTKRVHSFFNLHTWSGRAKAVEPALEIIASGAHQAVPGFVYTRDKAYFVRIGGDGITRDHTGQPISLDDAFEVRAYTETLDARFRRDGDDWRVAILTEDDAWVPSTDIAVKDDPVNIRSDLRRGTQYLLWGKVADWSKDWTTLTTARIGALHVPFGQAGDENGLAIAGFEYFHIAEDGNVVFAAERLTGFRGVTREKEKTGEAADAR